MPRLAQLWWGAWILGAGCAPGPDVPAPGDAASDAGADTADAASPTLIKHEAWAVLTADADPFDDRPAQVDCAPGSGWAVELLDLTPTLGVDTGACNYLAVAQPAGRDVAAGERLTVDLWHFALEGGGPAHAAVAIDGAVVWEREIEIPADSALIHEEVAVARGFAAGAPVVFHLHNHGLNTWNLIDVR